MVDEENEDPLHEHKCGLNINRTPRLLTNRDSEIYNSSQKIIENVYGIREPKSK